MASSSVPSSSLEMLQSIPPASSSNDYLQRYNDDDFNMSSISYNSRFMEQFKGIGDSVSQIGYSNNIDENESIHGMDLSQVHNELVRRESKIRELQTDKQKLKTLLKKAKDAIDSLNGKYKASLE